MTTSLLEQELTSEEKKHYQLPTDPLEKFQTLLQEALKAGEEKHEAFALSTCTPNGYPSVRYLLHKGLDEGRFLFFTNYHSPKAKDLLHHPWAAMAFLWKKTGVQVRIQGKIEKTSPEQSQNYFQSRPKKSQISACASPQSDQVPHRPYLEERWVRIEEQTRSQKVLSCPPFWGGYALTPHRMEFWFEQQDRFHDRFLYTPTELMREAGPYKTWHIHRLAP